MSDVDVNEAKKLCGEMSWEHFDRNVAPPVVLWRVDLERRFVSRKIRTSNWYASKQETDEFVRVQAERGSELMGIVEYHADPAATIAKLRADVERKGMLLSESIAAMRDCGGHTHLIATITAALSEPATLPTAERPATEKGT